MDHTHETFPKEDKVGVFEKPTDGRVHQLFVIVDHQLERIGTFP